MYDITVEMEDGSSHRVDVDGRDIRRWEIESSSSFLTNDFSYSTLTDLARLALKRTGKLVMSKTDFDAACINVKEEDRSEPEDPTSPDRTDEPS